MSQVTLAKDEQKIVHALLADPKKRYQLLVLLERELDQFGEWQLREKKKTGHMQEDDKKISFLRRLISRFNS